MKILVTGAAGFIGGQLWHTLWKRGDEVVGIDNFSYGNPDNLKFDDHDFGAEVRRMDIRDKAGMLALFEAEKLDVVYNIAGIAPLPDCQSDPVQAIEVNTLGLVNLLEAGRRTGIKQLVQASTNAMYENETEFPTVEGKFNPPTLIYPNTKYCGERFAQSFADTYGMTVTWMIVTFMVMISVAMFVVVQNQVYSFGGVEHLDMRGIVHQTVHPGLFEADVTDAEVGFAVAKGYELLRNRVVCFRTGTFGDHADYRELVACNGFREIALRFECDGNDRLFLSTALGRSSGARCQ